MEEQRYTLEDLVIAQDRTTYAIRALAKLFMIPAASWLAGVVIVLLGAATKTSGEFCSIVGCDNTTTRVGYAVAVLGSTWGVIEAWIEFRPSKID